MNKLVGIFFSFCLLASITAFSQVTIGSGNPADKGALLQLKDGTVGANGENATRGLALPRVALTDYKNLYPMFEADPSNVANYKKGSTSYIKSDEDAMHTGLVVYNVNRAFDKCNVASIPSGVHVWSGNRWRGVGTEEHFVPNPPDLAKTPWLYLKQPNTYILTPGSTGSVTIPVAKAFTVWKYWASATGGNKLTPRTFVGNLRANIEWQEGMGQPNNANDPILNTVTPFTLSSTAIGDSLSATITVNTTGNLGNAVVSLNDDNGVLWSWHIWVTADPTIDAKTVDENIFMDRNLGATSATPAADGSIGMLYQWGRNSPLPGYRTFSGVVSSVAQEISVAAAIASPENNGMTENTLAYAIKKPTYHITSANPLDDWYSPAKGWDNRWSDQITDECNNEYKATIITNPCPEGWEVPSFSNGNYPWGTTLNTPTYAEFQEDKGVDSSIVGYYPAAGYRTHDSKAITAIGILGGYLSASVNESNLNFLKGFYFVSSSLGDLGGVVLNTQSVELVRIAGNSVRCVKK